MGDYRILIVDDDADIAAIIAEHITDILATKVSTEVATDGEQALAILNREAFDLVTMDLKMPKMDGLSVVQRVRDGEGPNREVPFLLISGHLGMVSPKKHAETLRGVLFVDKPFRPASLERKLRLWLGSMVRARAAEAS